MNRMELFYKYYTGQETQVWLDFALELNYISQERFDNLDDKYEKVIGKLVNMAAHPEKWSY